MPITMKEHKLLVMKEICFQVEENSAETDVELFEHATNWLRDHQDYTLVEVGFSGDVLPERTKLILYVEQN